MIVFHLIIVSLLVNTWTKAVQMEFYSYIFGFPRTIQFELDREKKKITSHICGL